FTTRRDCGPSGTGARFVSIEEPVMIQLRGNINIRTIDGRRGPFNVGALVTPLGEFKVKDACLDQFDEGRYSGEFTIERIYPATYFAATRLIIEVRAQL